MIESITIKDVASYTGKEQVLNNLGEVNYIYGSNGSGKTTISRILNNPQNFPTCQIKWKNDAKLFTLVYNKDFVENHFSASTSLKGVFTLGKDSIDLKKNIEEKKILIEKLELEKQNLEITLKGGNGRVIGKNKELEELEKQYCDSFWNLGMIPYKDIFQECLKGVRSNKKLFKEKILELSNNTYKSDVTFEELQKKYEQLYNTTLKLIEKIQIPNDINLTTLESNPILKKKIIGCKDIDIASMIEKLNNSDWVRSGIQYYDENDQRCPFCQQKTEDSLRKKLSEYFDESFEQDINELKKLHQEYKTKTDNIRDYLKNLLENNNPYILKDRIKNILSLFEKTTDSNLINIQTKTNEPSQITNFESTAEIVKELEDYINEVNLEIEKNNNLLQNIENEKKTLTENIWHYILNRLSNEIHTYDEHKKNINQAISSLERQISEKKDNIKTEQESLKALEKQVTSIQPTCDEINKLLKSFGFTNFSLQVEDNISYKIVRPDGTSASETLSEGEKNFLTFLYFYNLINGSLTNNGIETNKVIVFDDPISSLDNDILFIVSSLIRNIIIDTNKEFRNIKQIFILTHNIYFHKEVSFKKQHGKSSGPNRKKCFWIIKKREDGSFITGYEDKNPIMSTYNALWLEIKSDTPNPIALPNSMRRILENYFNTLGGIPIEDLENKFSGEEKNICRSLCSWIHSGSHTCFGDEYYSSLDDALITKYKAVFRKIFEYNNQIGHYNMMMNIDDN